MFCGRFFFVFVIVDCFLTAVPCCIGRFFKVNVLFFFFFRGAAAVSLFFILAVFDVIGGLGVTEHDRLSALAGFCGCAIRFRLSFQARDRI